jgi:hypothetical protein
MVVDPAPPPDARQNPDYMVSDMLPPDAGQPDRGIVYDPAPPDAGRRDATPDYMVVDPAPPPDARQNPDYLISDMLPPDSGRPDATIYYDGPLPDAGHLDGGIGYDPPPPDAGKRDSGMVYDPVPPDAGRPDVMIVDMLPRDAGARNADVQPEVPPVYDPAPAPTGALSSTRGDSSAEVGSHWADTTPRRSPRTSDLPLSLPPDIRLVGEWMNGAVQVCLTGADEPLTIRWQSDGEVAGTDRQVTWTPASDQDQLNVAVRSRDGVAMAELRLGKVRGRRG